MKAEALTQAARDTILAALRAYEVFRRSGAWPGSERSEFITSIAEDNGEGLNWNEVRNLADGIGDGDLILCREGA